MEFHAKEQLPGLLDWMRQQMKACGGKTAVIGISGGKDSSVVAALAVAAYGKENVVGVLMPDGIQPDIDYSNGLVEFLGIRHYVFNIQGGTSGILDEMTRLGMEPSRQTGWATARSTATPPEPSPPWECTPRRRSSPLVRSWACRKNS